MHKLARQIRFAIDPFGKHECGDNSYCAKPGASGLAIYLALWIELQSKANPDTGFVVNVVEIDKVVRDHAITIFDSYIKSKFLAKDTVTFEQIAGLLGKTWVSLEEKFLPAKICSLAAELMPARKICIKQKDANMIYFSEKFEFAASHMLWNKKLTDAENCILFGKCANHTGHGHNYIAEVTIKKSQQQDAVLLAGDFEAVVKKEFINIVDHKNLNADVAHFANVNPTIENISEYAFNCLDGKFVGSTLDSVTVWESEKTFCTFRKD